MRQRRILVFSAIVEIGTGLLLMLGPTIVVRLLLGAEISGDAMLLGRCFGIALVALGMACWPSRLHEGGRAPAVRAMLVYNASIAIYLTYLGTAGHFFGILLWPAIGLHAVVAGRLLAWPRASAGPMPPR